MVRNGALDVLKIAMAVMVVGMHAGFLTDVNQFAAYLMLNGLFRIAVPLFLLINGYFFYRTTLESRQGAWFKRVAYLYLLWMVVYSPYWFPDGQHGAVSFTGKLLHTLFFGYYHLWYLSGMIGAAIVLSVVARAGASVALTVAGLAFLVGVGIQYVGSYHMLGDSHFAKILSLSWPHRNFMFFSFPFFCAGYFINKYQLLERVRLGRAAALVIIGMIFLMIESGLNFYASSGDSAFDNLVSLAILCPAVFALFMKLDIKMAGKEMAQYSTGIYLVHVMVIFLIQQFSEIKGTVLTAFVIVMATFLSYWLIKASKKVPFIL